MKNGFTLLEIIFVILIISLLAILGVPRFLRQGTSEVDNFIAKLNDMTFTGAQMARQSGKIQKILIDISGKEVNILDFDSKTPKMSFVIPETVLIEDVLIDRASVFSGLGEKISAYFLINPQGIAQDTTIIVIDEDLNARDHSLGRYEFVLNPFTGIFNKK